MWLKLKVLEVKETGVRLEADKDHAEWFPTGFIKSIPNEVQIGEVIDVNISDYFLEKLDWI